MQVDEQSVTRKRSVEVDDDKRMSESDQPIRKFRAKRLRIVEEDDQDVDSEAAQAGEKENTTPPKREVSTMGKSERLHDSDSETDVDEEKSQHTAEPAQKVKLHPMFLKKDVAADTTAKVSTEAKESKDDPVDGPDEDPTGDAEKNASKPAESSLATWKEGEPLRRLVIADALTKFFLLVLKLSSGSFLECVYLCLNKTCPEYEGKELGIGESVLIKAIAGATGRSAAKIKQDYHQVGDLGSVAQSSKKQQKTLGSSKFLTVNRVFQVLKDIASVSGEKAQQRKIDKINGLLVSCRGAETKFIIRANSESDWRKKTVLTAIAHAAILNNDDTKKWSKEKLEKELESGTAIIKQVYCELPNYDKIIPALIKTGIHKLHDLCKLTPGIPLKPMLAHPTKSLSEILDRFDNVKFTCEFKYDGERAQVHMLEDGTVTIFSRNSENLSNKYPDIVALVPKVVTSTVKSFVLDCEAVAWDVKKKCILPFQILSTRKRKDVAIDDIQVQVCLFGFDLLYLNEKPLITLSLRERRDLLQQCFIETEGKFAFAKSSEGSSVEEIQSFLDESIAGNCEGLMVKTLDEGSSYEPSVRSRNWLKVKKDYLNGVGDSLDLVVMGGYYGRGKRTGWFGGFLLACYDEETEEYQSICKIATGFSEDDLKKHAQFFSENTLEAPPTYYKFSDTPNIRPDVFFAPVQVWEVKAADLSISPVHQAGLGLVDPAKGISLRFPRFIRIRDDKTPEQATNSEQVADMYRSQNLNRASKTGGTADDDLEY
ncbi:putative CDC9-DNA ligase I [Zopfochytrium polystomum]|nr:putative CDC9-DNA ligase I [Zopfochytrium polystomum]